MTPFVVLTLATGALMGGHEPALRMAPVASQVRCLKALAALASEAIPVSADFEPVACPGRRIASAFHYDRVHKTTRLAREVAQAEIVRAYPEFGADMVRPGQILKLVIASGFFRVERNVVALQSARAGQHLFVKSSDGQILSVVYQGGVL